MNEKLINLIKECFDCNSCNTCKYKKWCYDNIGSDKCLLDLPLIRINILLNDRELK